MADLAACSALRLPAGASQATSGMARPALSAMCVSLLTQAAPTAPPLESARWGGLWWQLMQILALVLPAATARLTARAPAGRLRHHQHTSQLPAATAMRAAQPLRYRSA